MKKNSVILIVALMTFALLGVIFMQVYFLRNSYRLKAELFDQSVNAALVNVVSGLKKQQTVLFIQKNKKSIDSKKVSGIFIAAAPTGKDSPKQSVRRTDPLNKRFVLLLNREQKKADSIYQLHEANTLKRYTSYALARQEPLYRTEGDPQLQIRIEELEDNLGNLRQHISSQVVAGRITLKRDLPAKYSGAILPPRTDTVKQFIVQDSTGNFFMVPMKKPVINTLTSKSERELNRLSTVTGAKIRQLSQKTARKLVDSVQIEQKKDELTDLAKEMQFSEVSFGRRVKPLDSLLRAELVAHGIRIPYKTTVDSSGKAKSLFIQASGKAEAPPSNVYQAALFPNEFVKDGGGLLTLIFPGKENTILANMSAMMGASASLSLILMICFGYTLHSILKQKKISEMKTDFINNMTHEFKTPVSTIMIASEGLKDPDVSADKGRISRLAGIIYDENVRLANHIERVLNIARIDRADLKLESKPVEMHDLISAVTDSMELQLNKKNATLSLSLDAAYHTIAGDELHLSNVIFNLVDNAIKYSGERPGINIRTLNAGNNLVIRVSDNGIGMSRDQLSRIFEQFYRIPTGNLHDVKGFGLGLSYVNNIVKRLNGSVRVKSEKEKGSEFELQFSLI